MKLEALTPYTNRQATPLGFLRGDGAYVIVAEAHGHGHVELAERLSKAYNEHLALLSAAAAAEQALEALRLVWDDKSARFSTVHKGLPLTTVLRNAISTTALSLSELDSLRAGK